MMLTGSGSSVAAPSVATPAIGRRWVVPHLVAVAIASVTAVLFAVAARLELLTPTATMMNGDVFAQVTLLRDGLFAFGVTLPSIAALGHLLLPPASADSPSARLENLAVGAHLGGASLLLGATLTSGWAPLLLVAGAGALVCIAGTLQALAFLGRLRAAGRRDEQPAPFASALTLTVLAELLVLPITAAAFVVLVVEHATGQALWHGVGAEPSSFEHWLRLCMQPVAYVAVVPCLGVASEIVEAKGRAVTASMAAMLVLGGMAWAARLFGDGSAAAVAVSSFFSLALLAPVVVLVGHWLAALSSKTVPQWLAVAFIVCFVESALAALPLGLADVAQLLDAGAFGAAHRELLVATLGFAVAAALHRAWPTLTGVQPGRTPALVGGLIALLGLQLAIVPQLLGGLRGMPATLEYPARFHAVAILATVGWLAASGGAALVAGNLLVDLRRGTAAD